MPAPIYQQTGLTLSADLPNDPELVRALQQDLRTLGYLKAGIDRKYGPAVKQAVRALCFDLLHNDGQGRDGKSPVAMTALNAKPGGGQVITEIMDSVNEDLASVLSALINDTRIGRLPRSDCPAADNQAAIAAIVSAPNKQAPTPFVLAIVRQESGGAHFRVPPGGDEDSFVTVGLDHNASSDAISSRGYGIGQYTLFHHPPSVQDIADYVADPVLNVQNTYRKLRAKFDTTVVGKNGADDRTAEHPLLPLRQCRYAPSDARYMSDCRACARAVRLVDIVRGTPAFSGASLNYQPTQYYSTANYPSTPERADFQCDWPYAARRYNGSGINSFHYQTRILRNLL